MHRIKHFWLHDVDAFILNLHLDRACGARADSKVPIRQVVYIAFHFFHRYSTVYDRLLRGHSVGQLVILCVLLEWLLGWFLLLRNLRLIHAWVLVLPQVYQKSLQCFLESFDFLLTILLSLKWVGFGDIAGRARDPVVVRSFHVPLRADAIFRVVRKVSLRHGAPRQRILGKLHHQLLLFLQPSVVRKECL